MMGDYKDLEEELKKRINNNNYKIINELIEIIVEENITTIENLKKYQDDYFVVDGRVLSHKEQIEYCKNIIMLNPYIPENIDFIDVQKIINLKENLKNENNEKKITTILIELFSILGKSMMLPYDAYKMIIENQ